MWFLSILSVQLVLTIFNAFSWWIIKMKSWTDNNGSYSIILLYNFWIFKNQTFLYWMVQIYIIYLLYTCIKHIKIMSDKIINRQKYIYPVFSSKIYKEKLLS